MMRVQCVAHVGILMCSTTYLHELVLSAALCDRNTVTFRVRRCRYEYTTVVRAVLRHIQCKLQNAH